MKTITVSVIIILRTGLLGLQTHQSIIRSRPVTQDQIGYGHCSQILTTPGETVKKGQIIAKSGDRAELPTRTCTSR